jgi:hypothetical protein
MQNIQIHLNIIFFITQPVAVCLSVSLSLSFCRIIMVLQQGDEIAREV